MKINNHDALCVDWYRRLIADGTAEDGQRIAVEMHDQLAAAEKENAMLQEALEKNKVDNSVQNICRAGLTLGIRLTRLEEICNAEREGRCEVLPCKAGDTVYVLKYSLAQKCKIITEQHCVAVKVFSKGFVVDSVQRASTPHMVQKSEYGYQCFATREAAERALKERETI